MTDEEYKYAWDHGLPIEDDLCLVCKTPYSRGCKRTHGHNGNCIDIDDIRHHGEGYAHKECSKSGA